MEGDREKPTLNTDANQGRITDMPRQASFLFVLATTVSLSGGVAVAQGASPAEFFKDKTIRVLVGHPPGGSYDFYARLAADMLKAHLPGVKAVIVENKPGGGGLVATSWFYTQAPQDGTMLAVLPETIGNTQLMEPEVGKWNVERFRYIGSFASANSVFMRRKDSPSKTAEDMKQKETIVGCTGTTAQSYQYPALLKALGGFKFKMICGYPGANEYSIALERGEIDLVSSAWNSWRVTHKRQLDAGELVAVIQTGLKRNHELPDVPLMQELVDDPESKQVIEFASAGAMIGRALLAPPGVPEERIAFLRGIFDKMVKDPAMIAMATQRNLELDPTPGTVVQGYSDAIVKTPPAIVAKAAMAFKG
jgi:tripartite-type tricarboxylate transporter receptor subunit TctC